MTVVHLVHPPPYGEVPFKHLGLCSIAASLRAEGLETRYLDVAEQCHRRGDDAYHDLILRLSHRAGEMTDLPDLDVIAEVLGLTEPSEPAAAALRRQVEDTLRDLDGADLVGLTFNTLTAPAALALGRRLRRRGARVVLGGPLTRIDAATHLALRLDAADAVVVGEGDHVAPTLFRALDERAALDDLPGVAWVEEGSVRARAPAPPPALDALPRPCFEGNVLDQFVPIAASRGCPRRCAYCSEPGLWGGRGGHRRRAPRDVAAEMDARARETGLRDFHFHDDLLNGRRSWLVELVGAVAGRDLTWESFFEPYRLDEPLLDAMAGAGCRLIKYGVQSFSPEVLAAMGRPRDLDAVIETVVATFQRGISTHFDMLIGHPGETEEDHRRNIEVIEELYRRTGDSLHFSLNPYYLAAGSAVWRAPGRWGVEPIDADPAVYPAPIAAALEAGPPYPMGYRSALGRETIMRRMDELAGILRAHGRDYLYLGQRRLPENPRGRRMLPPLDALSPRPPLVTLRLIERGNTGLWPTGEGLRAVASAADIEARLAPLAPGATVRFAGGEPTLTSLLPAGLALCRARGLHAVVETNGLRLASPKYRAALRRYGLDDVVLLLASMDVDEADGLAGHDGALGLALDAARRLVGEGVRVELALLATPSSLHGADALAPFADEVGAARAFILRCPLEGPARPEASRPADAEAVAARLGLPVELRD